MPCLQERPQVSLFEPSSLAALLVIYVGPVSQQEPPNSRALRWTLFVAGVASSATQLLHQESPLAKRGTRTRVQGNSTHPGAEIHASDLAMMSPVPHARIHMVQDAISVAQNRIVERW